MLATLPQQHSVTFLDGLGGPVPVITVTLLAPASNVTRLPLTPEILRANVGGNGLGSTGVKLLGRQGRSRSCLASLPPKAFTYVFDETEAYGMVSP